MVEEVVPHRVGGQNGGMPISERHGKFPHAEGVYLNEVMRLSPKLPA